MQADVNSTPIERLFQARRSRGNVRLETMTTASSKGMLCFLTSFYILVLDRCFLFVCRTVPRKEVQTMSMRLAAADMVTSSPLTVY